MLWQREATYAWTTIERLQREQILLKQENARLKEDAENHADVLAKARDEYVETFAKHKAEAAEALAAAKSAATSWEEKAKAAEKQAKDDREASDSALKKQAAKYSALEKVVLESCHDILGEFFCTPFFCCLNWRVPERGPVFMRDKIRLLICLRCARSKGRGSAEA